MAKRNDALIAAIKKGDIISFMKLEKSAVIINETGSEGITPLIATIVYDKFVMFGRLIIQNKLVDLNAEDDKGKTALIHAISLGRSSYKIQLLARGAR